MCRNGHIKHLSHAFFGRLNHLVAPCKAVVNLYLTAQLEARKVNPNSLYSIAQIHDNHGTFRPMELFHILCNHVNIALTLYYRRANAQNILIHCNEIFVLKQFQ